MGPEEEATHYELYVKYSTVNGNRIICEYSDGLVIEYEIYTGKILRFYHKA